MARTTYKHLTATGELETRTSEREYTHVIVGTYLEAVNGGERTVSA